MGWLGGCNLYCHQSLLGCICCPQAWAAGSAGITWLQVSKGGQAPPGLRYKTAELGRAPGPPLKWTVRLLCSCLRSSYAAGLLRVAEVPLPFPTSLRKPGLDAAVLAGLASLSKRSLRRGQTSHLAACRYFPPWLSASRRLCKLEHRKPSQSVWRGSWNQKLG